MIRSALPLIIVSLLAFAACDRNKGEKPAAEKEDPTVSAAKSDEEAAKPSPAKQAEPSADDSEEDGEPEAAGDEPGDEADEGDEE